MVNMTVNPTIISFTSIGLLPSHQDFFILIVRFNNLAESLENLYYAWFD